MSLAPGTRIGVYEVEAVLGAGAMGEVYRALDTRLGRMVAIKVLPDSLTHDRERLARLEREARALAALNHQNIAVLYGVEETGGGLALVIELIEGETLARRLARGLTMPEALELARQIAAALDAAHEKGVVHRDLKLDNVMVTPAGTVKVLDFGLAKLVEAGPGGYVTQAVTETRATVVGAIMGTPAYMSPEQARGQTADKRADIWAFGCVLFELLSSRRAFDEATLSDTLAAILTREPDWTLLPSTTPARVIEVLRRCLAKELTRRARDIGDVALDLDTAQTDNESSPAALGTRGAIIVWKVASMVATIVASGAVFLLLWQRGEPAPPTVLTPTAIGALRRVTSDQGLSTDPSLSADGRILAYASNRAGAGNLDIYVQQTAGGTYIRLTSDSADDHQPNLSPDGSLVVFRSERSPRGIYVASALGGEARFLAPDGMRPVFSPDGLSIAYWTGASLAPRASGGVRQTFVMPAGGGTPTRVATSLKSAGDVVWAPDGRSVLVFGRQAASDEPDWWWQRVDGGAAVRTGALARFNSQGNKGLSNLAFPYPLGWVKAGVMFSGDRGSDEGDAQGIWMVAVDPASGRLEADAVRLTNGTTRDLSASVAQDGRMVFAALHSLRTTFALPLDANAAKAAGPFRLIRDDRIDTGRTSVSEDGRVMVLPRYELNAGGLWVRDLGTGQERQLAATPRTPLNPVMSADGDWVAYTITRVVTGGDAGFGDVLIVQSAGGVPRKVCESCQAAAWVRDNQQLVITEGPSYNTLMRVNVTSGERTPMVVVSSGSVDRPLFGPNGRWVTFNSNQGVFVAPVYADRASSESEWTKLVALNGGERSTGLSPDGGLLYLLLERDGFRCLYAMRIDPSTGTSRSEPFLVAHVHDASRQWGTTGFGSAVVRGMFVANLFETTGSLWMTTLETAR